MPPGNGVGNVKNLLNDTEIEGTAMGTTWRPGLDGPLPYGLIFDMGVPKTVGQVELRNGMAKVWMSGTKDFEISIGDTGWSIWLDSPGLTFQFPIGLLWLMVT